MASAIETLNSYVPRLVARRLAADPAPLAGPVSDHLPAAMLFADISGFTAMTEQLLQQGPQGLEQITEVLNSYFGRLIALIGAHGGDVVKFAGDAVLALWPAGAGDLATAVQRAAACGLAVQSALPNYQVAEGRRLAVRIGIGAGDVAVAQMGGVGGRWELLVAGPPVLQMSAAEQQAQPGEVVVSPEAWTLVAHEGAGTPLPGGGVRLERVRAPRPVAAAPAPELAPEVEPALRAYIPGAVLARLRAAETGWLAELRRVTVLFLNLPAFSHTMPLDQAQTTMHALQTILQRYEGTVNKLSVDDKGASLVIAFGLPPLAHEDDAVRGAQAALALAGYLRDAGMPGAIGVTTGRAFCGIVGSTERREYTMIGAVVNLAARLMQAAPGAILCDSATYQAAQAQVEFAVLRPIHVKGRSDAVPVYRPLGVVRAVEAPQPALIGRAAERAALEAALGRLTHGGDGGVVFIEGEAGIGKSRLALALREDATGQDITVLAGAGNAMDQATAYHAWRPVFDAVFDRYGAHDAAARRERVLATLAAFPDGLRLAPLLDTLLQLDLPETDITAQMSAQVRAENTRILLVGLLLAVARRGPALLVLEDAQWMDSASWALAVEAASRVRSLLLVVVTRPPGDPPPGEYRALLTMPGAQRIRLDSLPPAETLALVCARLGVPTLPEPVAALIRDKAEGHPLFSEELAYALRDAGLLIVADGECRLAPGAADLRALTFPDNVQGVITSRIDRLTPQQQVTLKAASVIGRVFPVRVLRDIHPIEDDKPHLVRELQTLDRLNLTLRDSPPPDLAYMFKHVITQEVAYNLMLFAQRRQLHRAVAEWYEARYANDLAPYYAILAHHWGKAEVADKTLFYLEKAGQAALRSYANQEAISFFRDLLALHAREGTADEQTRRARWEWQVGEAHYGLGQLAESRAHLERAAALFEQPLPQGTVRMAFGLLNEIRRQVGHRVRLPLQRQRAGRRPNPQRAVLLEAARTFERLGQIFYVGNEALPAGYAALRCLNLAESAGPSPELARAYATVSGAASIVPLYRLARAYGRRAQAIANRVRDLPTQLWVLQVIGYYNIGIGHWTEAREALTRGMAIADQLGDRRRSEESLGLLMVVAYLQGEFAARRAHSAQYAASTHGGDPQIQFLARTQRVENALPVGDLAAAQTALDEAMPLLAANLGAAAEILGYGLLALTRLRHSDPVAAREHARHAAARIAATSPTLVYALEGYAAVAETTVMLWETGRHDPATARADRRAAHRAVRALNNFARVFPIAAPRAGRWRGVVAWLDGHPALARTVWARSLETATRLAMPYEQALLHYEMGRHARGRARRAHLAQARAIFARLGATGDLARLDAVARDP
jgi:class 3 adenylate cyclase